MIPPAFVFVGHRRGFRSRSVSRVDASLSEAGRLHVPPRLDIGDVAAGLRVASRLSISNPGDASIVVAKVDSSCPCLRVAPGAFVARPHSTTDVTMTYDASEAPDFRGVLALEVRGRDAGGGVLFQTRVDLRVVSRAARASSAVEMEGGS